MTIRFLRTLAAAIAIATALGGCVVSSHPVIAEADATFDERLLGTWEEVGGDDRAVVTRGASGTYAILFTDARDTTRLAGRLGQLGGRPTLDLWPVPQEKELPSDYASLLLPAHVIVVLDIGAQEIGMSLLEPDSLLRVLRTAPGAPRYEAPDRRLVLHGTTAELRSLLAGHVGRPGMLSKPERMRRVKPADGGAR